MSVIWRFPITAARDQFFSVPRGSRLIKVLVKDNEPQVYFLVNDPEADRGDVMLFVVPTGVPLTELEARGVYLDSFVRQEPTGTLVFHVFLEKENA